MEKLDSPLISANTRIYLRDVYDHVIQVIEMLDSNRDLLGGIHDTWLSAQSNRMNDVMRVLTTIATVFIPLTFIAGIYGMNFDNMPELHWASGYYLCIGLMIAIAIGLVLFFKYRRWL